MLTALIAASAMFSPAVLLEVPAQRIPRLTRGINLSHWWAQAGTYELSRINSQMTKEDFRQIADSGFRHVRLTLEAKAVWDLKVPVKLDPDKVKALKEDLREIKGAGLAAIVDIHPDDEFKKWLSVGEVGAAFVSFWTELASVLKDTDPEWTFFEVLNEPVIESDVWLNLQENVLRGVRPVAPRHTIIVSGGKWSGIDEFLKMKPYADKNLVYNFHSYDPFHFTHQGATWGWEATRHFRDLPYPSSPSAVAPILPKIQNEQARGYVKDYGDQRWNYQKLENLFEKVAEWGRKHRVPVTCNEFGAYNRAPRASRLRYIEDARKALEANGIGWAMWDYAGGFGAFTGATPGNRSADSAVLKALGLR